MTDEQQTIPEASATEPQAAEATGDEKYQNLYNQYVRLSADFDNYRKRTQQETEAFRKYASESTVENLFPAIDNIERAFHSLSEASDAKLLYQSFRLIYNQLIEGLSRVGVTRIQAVGQPFDPAFHEAVSQLETTEMPPDTVMQELQGGYLVQDKVLRPALVAVAKAPEASSEETCNPFSQTSGQSYVPPEAP
jgi:molecular chaperone GrpE